jgi:hypothetical protein
MLRVEAWMIESKLTIVAYRSKLALKMRRPRIWSGRGRMSVSHGRNNGLEGA